VGGKVRVGTGGVIEKEKRRWDLGRNAKRSLASVWKQIIRVAHHLRGRDY